MSILKYIKTSLVGGTHPQSHVAVGYQLTIPEPQSDDCALPDSLGTYMYMYSSASIGGTTVDSGEPESVASAQWILPLTPNQPKLKFPTRTLGSQKRSFNFVQRGIRTTHGCTISKKTMVFYVFIALQLFKTECQ